jgi:hypothetical protein
MQRRDGQPWAWNGEGKVELRPKMIAIKIHALKIQFRSLSL